MIYVCECAVGEQTHSRWISYRSRLVSYYGCVRIKNRKILY